MVDIQKMRTIVVLVYYL